MNLSESETRVPTYLYGCPDRHFSKEVSHSMMHEPVILCEVCEKEMNRKPQPAGVKFYGTGFYTTDKNESK